MNTVLSQVTVLLVETLGVSPEEVTPEVVLADLDVDSLAMVEFAMAAKTELGVDIGDNELTSRNTVRDMVELIECKRVAR